MREYVPMVLRSLFLFPAILAAANAQQSCEQLAGLSLPGVTITSAVSVPAGPLSIQGVLTRVFSGDVPASAG